jgi:hypothetical protein
MFLFDPCRPCCFGCTATDTDILSVVIIDESSEYPQNKSEFQYEASVWKNLVESWEQLLKIRGVVIIPLEMEVSSQEDPESEYWLNEAKIALTTGRVPPEELPDEYICYKASGREWPNVPGFDIYVQLPESYIFDVIESAFTRPPLAISVAVDVSGSMEMDTVANAIAYLEWAMAKYYPSTSFEVIEFSTELWLAELTRNAQRLLQ